MKSLTYFIIFVVAFALFTGIFLFVRKGNDSTSTTTQKQTTSKNKFAWGIQFSTFPLNSGPDDSFNSERVEKEMQLLQPLGVSHLRFNLEFYESEDIGTKTIILDNVNDTLVDLSQKYGYEPVFVIETGKHFNDGTVKDSYDKGYERAFNAAKRYKGKVKYYQLANEITGGTLWQDGDSGEAINDPYGYRFNKKRYDRMKSWLEGMSAGIKAADPSAKKIISGHWAWHTAIDQMIKDGVDFDIIGWAWYSPDGTDVEKLEIENNGKKYSINLAQELSKHNKDVWIIESNRDNGTYDPDDNQGEEKQAQFFQAILDNMYQSGHFKGYFVYSALDTPKEVADATEQQWGLITIKKDPQTGKYTFGEPKKSFAVYRDFIKKHR